MVFIHDAETVIAIAEQEHKLVSIRMEGTPVFLLTEFSLQSTLPPDHSTLRQAYFKAMTDGSLRQYLPAIHSAVSANLSALESEGAPLSMQTK